MIRNEKLFWIVSCDFTVKGGGVARAISMLRHSAILDCHGVRTIQLASMPWKERLKFFAPLFCIYPPKTFLLHSIFDVNSILLFMLSRRSRFLVMPHGEMLSSALKLKKYKKVLALIFIKNLFKIHNHKIYLIASGREEIDNARRYFSKIDDHVVALDLVDHSMLLNNERSDSPSNDTNVVLISRLVKNKGINDFLKKIIDHIDREKKSDFIQSIKSINLFLVPEAASEYSALLKNVEVLRGKCELNVNLWFDLNHGEISKIVSKIENKVAIVPSQFESFSNVLVETLNFEYLPIVWFRNSLVDKLEREGLCLPLAFGALPERAIRNKENIKVLSIIDRMGVDSEIELKNFFSKYFSL